MRTTTRMAILLIFPLMVIGLVACGAESDGVANGETSSSTPTSVPVVDEVDSPAAALGDSEAVAAEETALAEHNEDPHEETIAEDHAEADSESAPHADNSSDEIDPNAPVMHIIGNEFGYEAAIDEVVAGEAFTIMFHNEGNLEHDITFKGLENLGGVHLQPGEDGKSTFTLDEAGEVSYYCTIPGHLEAGMISSLTVVAAAG